MISGNTDNGIQLTGTSATGNVVAGNLIGSNKSGTAALASIEFNNVVRFPKEQMSLTIARKGRSFLAKIIWWRDNFVGVAFSSESPSELPGSDLAERLRKSELKKRKLQRCINELLEG